MTVLGLGSSLLDNNNNNNNNVNGNHWLAISTLDSDSSGYEVKVYDSLNFSLSKETKALLAKLLKTTKKRLLVKFGNTIISKLSLMTVAYLQPLIVQL